MARLLGSLTPPISFEAWMEEKGTYAGHWEYENQWVAEKAEQFKADGDGPLCGTELTWPAGDGHARYLVEKEKPLCIWHLEVGDRWHADPILLRGLRLSDVKQMVERQRRLAELLKRPRLEPLLK